ncbi:hypothetical protein BC567DRAFT_294077 [Phyllosticta citribraziliensis]
MFRSCGGVDWESQCLKEEQAFGIETLSSKPVSKALPRPSQKIEALLQVSACAPVNHTIISANMTTPHDREKISALESKIKQLNMAHNVEMTEALNAVDYDVEKMAAAVEANEKLAEELKKVEQYERDLIVENIHLKRQVNRLQAKMKSVVETNKMAVEELKKIRNSMKWMNEQAKAMMEDKEVRPESIFGTILWLVVALWSGAESVGELEYMPLCLRSNFELNTRRAASAATTKTKTTKITTTPAPPLAPQATQRSRRHHHFFLALPLYYRSSPFFKDDKDPGSQDADEDDEDETASRDSKRKRGE